MCEAPEMAVLFTRCIVKRCFACECLEALPRIVAPLQDLTQELLLPRCHRMRIRRRS